MTIAEKIIAALKLQPRSKILHGRLVEHIPGSLAAQQSQARTTTSESPFSKGIVKRSAVFLDYPELQSAKLIPKNQISLAGELFQKALEGADTPLFDPSQKGNIEMFQQSGTPIVYDLAFRDQLNSQLGNIKMVSPKETLKKFEKHASSGSAKGLKFITGLKNSDELGFYQTTSKADSSPMIHVASEAQMNKAREKAINELKARNTSQNAQTLRFMERAINDPGSIIGHEFEHAISEDNNKYYKDYKLKRKRLAYVETPAVFAEIAHQLNAVKPESYSGLKAIQIRPSIYSGTDGEKGGGVSADFFRRLAQEKFINKGRSMTELLATPEGRQFLSNQMGRSKENKAAMEIAKKSNLDPIKVEQLLNYIKR